VTKICSARPSVSDVKMPTSDTRSVRACSSRINSAVAGNAEANVVPPAFEQMCSFELANANSRALSPQHAHEVGCCRASSQCLR